MERRDAFPRYNPVGTETPSRFGGRRYGPTTNPAQRFEERVQYGSSVCLAGQKINVLCPMRAVSKSFNLTRDFITDVSRERSRSTGQPQIVNEILQQ